MKDKDKNYNFIGTMSKVESKSVVVSKHNKATLSPVRAEKYSAIDFNYRTKQDPLWGKDQSYFRRKLNEGLNYERQYIDHTGLASSLYNNPETASPDRSDFYRRERYQSAKRETVTERKAEVPSRRVDILNNPRAAFAGRNEDKYFESMGRSELMKDSPSPFRKTLTHLMRFQPEITSKIGAVASRDYTIPRPQLKVGKPDYIDTYSPF